MQTETCGLEKDEKKIEVINGSEYREVSIEIDPENNKVKDQLPKEEEADIYDSKIEGKPLITCYFSNQKLIF